MMSAAISGSIERGVLECPICMDPLQPPVYQPVAEHIFAYQDPPKSVHFPIPINSSRAGPRGGQGVRPPRAPKIWGPHPVCSRACDLLVLPCQPHEQGHVPHGSATGGYNRCNALNKILESFRVPCANTKYGCTVESHYHEADGHKKSCLHTPCFCPEPGCVFAGSTVALLDHLTGDHIWPSTELKYNVKITLDQKGIHALHSRDGGLLFLVKFTPVPPFGHATSVLSVDPHATATVEAECKFRCHLSSSNADSGWQKSLDFQVRSTNLSEGLLAPEDGGYSFVAPNTISITVSIAKIMREKRGNEI
ncbi:hypothetical protein ACQ4PT_039454 [Festuca glaucescens]